MPLSVLERELPGTSCSSIACGLLKVLASTDASSSVMAAARVKTALKKHVAIRWVPGHRNQLKCPRTCVTVQRFSGGGRNLSGHVVRIDKALVDDAHGVSRFRRVRGKEIK